MRTPALEQDGNIYTVSRLNAEIKGLLETSFPLVWVRGEISNFRVPGSGHYYFTLKDEDSQIRAVFFRPHNRHLRFQPEAGMQVLCQARVGVYEPRGEYQLIVEVMEPQGVGALQLAFEQLKKKLAAEGLFDSDRKTPLPFCPQHIAIVTSPTGAAIRDMLKVFQRSPYPLSVTLLPSLVQGQGAAQEIASAIATADQLAGRFGWDLLIVGRGGGSVEDLWPFNEEAVARALSACSLPTISAVGHEIDFTISDLVADVRMPTPTAAAEWVVTRLEKVHRDLIQYRDRIARLAVQTVETGRMKFRYVRDRLPDPMRRIEDLRLYLDDRLERLEMGLVRRLQQLRTVQARLDEKLHAVHPARIIQGYRTALEQETRQLLLGQKRLMDANRLRLQSFSARLESLSPLNVLSRGYSITYRLPKRKLVVRSTDVHPGDRLLVKLSEGSLDCIVDETRDEDRPGVHPETRTNE
jgi:exodeoxyribonuclease VII large subunit